MEAKDNSHRSFDIDHFSFEEHCDGPVCIKRGNDASFNDKREMSNDEWKILLLLGRIREHSLPLRVVPLTRAHAQLRMSWQSHRNTSKLRASSL